MSSLIVEMVGFDVERHPNADKISLAKIRGKAWQCVINHEQWGLKAGDVGKGVYIPAESVVPDNLIQEHNLANYTHKGRIKGIRLRGELSQGLLLPIGGTIQDRPVGTRMEEELGIIKYVAPIPVHLSGEIESQPEGWHKYTDIENIKNYPNVFEKGENVHVIEKIHGANMSILKQDDKLYVSSHNLCLKRNENNAYWRAVLPLEEELLKSMENGWILYGELIGVQDLKYGHENGKVSVRFFDLFRGTDYVSWLDLIRFMHKTFGPNPNDYTQLLVPIITAINYNYKEAENLSKGNTMVEGVNHIREGIVIRPYRERYDSKIGRVILKFINDDYLLKDNRTEYK